MRTVKAKKCKDYTCLYKQEHDEQGREIPNESLAAFDDAVRCKMIELRFDHELDSATQLYSKMQQAIQHAVDTVLPECVKTNGVKRDVSDHTKSLYDERVRLRSRPRDQATI